MRKAHPRGRAPEQSVAEVGAVDGHSGHTTADQVWQAPLACGHGRVGDAQPVLQVAVDAAHQLALDADGQVATHQAAQHTYKWWEW